MNFIYNNIRVLEYVIGYCLRSSLVIFFFLRFDLFHLVFIISIWIIFETRNHCNVLYITWYRENKKIHRIEKHKEKRKSKTETDNESQKVCDWEKVHLRSLINYGWSLLVTWLGASGVLARWYFISFTYQIPSPSRCYQCAYVYRSFKVNLQIIIIRNTESEWVKWKIFTISTPFSDETLCR